MLVCMHQCNNNCPLTPLTSYRRNICTGMPFNCHTTGTSSSKNVHRSSFFSMMVHFKLQAIFPSTYEVAFKLLILFQFFLDLLANIIACLLSTHSFLMEAIHQHLSNNLHHTQKSLISRLQHPRVEGLCNVI